VQVQGVLAVAGQAAPPNPVGLHPVQQTPVVVVAVQMEVVVEVAHPVDLEL
jgi:hypothetical protein